MIKALSRARLGVAGHRATKLRWRNPAQCFSQRYNTIGLTRFEIEPESRVLEADTLSSRPPERNICVMRRL